MIGDNALLSNLFMHYAFDEWLRRNFSSLKWRNCRSQRHSFDWDGFNQYMKNYPLPTPRIAHNLYTLSHVP